MAFDQSTGGSADALRLGRGEKLSRVEQIVILVIVSITVALDVISFITAPGGNPLGILVSIASTASFALYLWNPLIATCALGVVFALSFFVGTESLVLTAAAVAAGLVMRLGWTSLVLSYTGAFLIAAALVANAGAAADFNVGLFLILSLIHI